MTHNSTTEVAVAELAVGDLIVLGEQVRRITGMDRHRGSPEYRLTYVVVDDATWINSCWRDGTDEMTKVVR
jgi:hypothetical protein